jgi:hypothetical protein
MGTDHIVPQRAGKMVACCGKLLSTTFMYIQMPAAGATRALKQQSFGCKVSAGSCARARCSQRARTPLAACAHPRPLALPVLRRNERLASDSEAVVKAEGSHCAETIEEMQRLTVELVTVGGAGQKLLVMLGLAALRASSKR